MGFLVLVYAFPHLPLDISKLYTLPYALLELKKTHAAT